MLFFDDPRNRVGILTTRLSRDASLVQGVSCSTFYQTFLCSLLHCSIVELTVWAGAILNKLLRYRMAGITESAMVAYTHKYAVV